MKVVLCIPTLNAGNNAGKLISAISGQTHKPDNILIIDSGSSDDSPVFFRAAGMRVHVIPPSEFSHGGTRQLCVDMSADAGFIVFLTQDAFFAHVEALENLLKCFEDESVGAVYGRQLPRRGASSIEAHARLFNYPQTSQIKTMADAPRLGIKTAFISNSFAAYRRTALMTVGGFPRNMIMSEDTYVAARMLISGLKIVYCADAWVYHSHNYGFIEEFKRYFDIGVFQSRERWIRQTFGQAEGEGLRYVRSELNYLWHENRMLIPASVFRNTLKLVGYKLGLQEKRIPHWLKVCLSMNKRFWEKQRASAVG